MEILGGPVFGVAGAGESHGPGVVTIVFGCPPGITIERTRIQSYLDRRRPGSTKLGTPRHEADRVVLLSGLFQPQLPRLLEGPQLRVVDEIVSTYEAGMSSGEPIAALTLSTSSKSEQYDQFAGETGEVRPGHTDLVKHYQSQGFADYRGGGRSSYRSTISDVIGGSVARILLDQYFQTRFVSSVVQVGDLRTGISLSSQLDRMGSPLPATTKMADDWQSRMDANPIPALDADFADAAAELIQSVRREGDSIGAQLEVVALNPPALVGVPLYNSLKLRLMGSLGGLHAVQACEIGAGSKVVTRQGSRNNDPIRSDGYQSNSHGGLIGGVTTGSPIVFRVSFKPTSSISKPQESVRKNLEEIDFKLKKGRHDPCVGIRAGITLESRIAIELANAVLSQQASRVHPQDFSLFPK